jgi:acetyltransferase-like isoleucine patch superfamily enzyme
MYKKIKKRIILTFSKLRSAIWGIGLKKAGKNLDIRFPVKFEGKGFVEIGDDVSINAFVHVWGHGSVKIGNRVMIASHSIITTLSHDTNYKCMRFGPEISKPIVIEDDVWIGSNVTILPGVTIGKGAVLGACSLINKDVPPYAIMIGSPARVLKIRTIIYE